MTALLAPRTRELRPNGMALSIRRLGDGFSQQKGCDCHDEAQHRGMKLTKGTSTRQQVAYVYEGNWKQNLKGQIFKMESEGYKVRQRKKDGAGLELVILTRNFEIENCDTLWIEPGDTPA